MAIKTGSLNKIEHQNAEGVSNEILTTLLHSAEDLVVGHGWLDSINNLLREVGRATKVSRVWIFQTLDLQEEYILQDYVFEWASEDKYAQIGLPHFNYFRSELSEPEYHSLIKSRLKGEYQQMIVSELADSWLKSFLSQQNIQSMLTIPIIVDNQWWGTLGLDDCERPYPWSTNEITLLRTASYFISSAIVRDNLQTRNHQLDLLKKSSVCSTWELDIRRGHLWCTPEILGSYTEATQHLHFPLRHWIRRIHPEQRKAFFNIVRRSLAHPEQEIRYDFKVLKSSGEYCWIEVCANNADYSNAQEHTIAGIFWDISKRKEQEQRLIYDATTDALTGLFNRRKMIALIQESQSKIGHNRGYFSLAVLDIDHFKSINDTYGHTVGDEVLTQFSTLCMSLLRKGDHIARIGGEEFALLLSDTTEQEAYQICQRLCKTVVDNPCTAQGVSIDYSVSIGVTTVNSSTTEINRLFSQADQAMYQAKQAGRNRVMSAPRADNKAQEK